MKKNNELFDKMKLYYYTAAKRDHLRHEGQFNNYYTHIYTHKKRTLQMM